MMSAQTKNKKKFNLNSKLRGAVPWKKKEKDVSEVKHDLGGERERRKIERKMDKKKTGGVLNQSHKAILE